MRRVLSRLLRWGTTAIRCFAPIGLATTSIAAMVARPLLGSTLVVKMPIVVVLPAPLGPSSPKVSPRRTLNEMSSTALRCARR